MNKKKRKINTFSGLKKKETPLQRMFCTWAMEL